MFLNGADIRSKTNYNSTVLHWFCCRGNLEGIKFALNFIDINSRDSDNDTPLHFSIYEGCEDICEFLCTQQKIDKNAKNNQNRNPLSFAIYKNRQNIVNILRRNGFPE